MTTHSEDVIKAESAGWKFEDSDPTMPKGFWWKKDPQGDGNDDYESRVRGFSCLTVISVTEAVALDAGSTPVSGIANNIAYGEQDEDT
jgi:hypothetical protein